MSSRLKSSSSKQPSKDSSTHPLEYPYQGLTICAPIYKRGERPSTKKASQQQLLGARAILPKKVTNASDIEAQASPILWPLCTRVSYSHPPYFFMGLGSPGNGLPVYKSIGGPSRTEGGLGGTDAAGTSESSEVDKGILE